MYVYLRLYCISDEDVDKEEVYRMANVMAECGGLDVMLQRLVITTR